MVRTQIQLTERQVDGLKRLAAKERVSMAEVIRRAVDRSLALATLPDEAAIRRRAMAAAGRFHDTASDVSERHDEYLADAFSQ